MLSCERSCQQTVYINKPYRCQLSVMTLRFKCTVPSLSTHALTTDSDPMHGAVPFCKQPGINTGPSSLLVAYFKNTMPTRCMMWVGR